MRAGQDANFKLGGDGDQKDSFVEEELEDDIPLKAPEVAEAPVSMSYLGNTIEFPRKDNVYKKKEALPFDEYDSLVWRRA
jgi:hypothetical protein